MHRSPALLPVDLRKTLSSPATVSNGQLLSPHASSPGLPPQLRRRRSKKTRSSPAPTPAAAPRPQEANDEGEESELEVLLHSSTLPERTGSTDDSTESFGLGLTDWIEPEPAPGTPYLEPNVVGSTYAGHVPSMFLRAASPGLRIQPASPKA